MKTKLQMCLVNSFTTTPVCWQLESTISNKSVFTGHVSDKSPDRQLHRY